MATEIASLFAKISASTEDFERGAKRVRDDMTAMEKGMSSIGTLGVAAFKAVGAAAVAMGAAVAAGVGASVVAAANMEQGIADIGAMMALTSEETDKLQDHIMELGLSPTLKVSATEAADAVMALGTAGLTMTEIMGGASEATVLLANATGLKGGEGFAAAANIATDVMAQFNITADQMDKAVNQIAGTTVASKFTVDDYRLAIGQAGGVAGAVGVTFEDFNAEIAATSSSFNSGSDGATSYKTFLQRLVPTTVEATNTMIELGLATADGTSKFFDSSGAIKSAEERAALLQQAFGGLSDAQKISAASTIFGTDAMRTALALAEGGTTIITNMKTEIGKVDAEELAAKRMDTLAGSWEIFRGVMETLSLGLGEKFIPVIRVVVDWFTSLAQTYGPPVIDFFGAFIDRIAKFIPLLTEQNLLYEDGSGLLMQLTKLFGFSQEAAQAFWGEVWLARQALGDFIESVKDAFKPMINLVKEYVNWTDVVIGVAVALTAMLSPAIAGAVVALGGFVVSMLAVAAPILAAIAAVAALRYAWEHDLGGIRKTTAFVWGVVIEVFDNVTGSLKKLVDNFKVEWGELDNANATIGERLALVWDAVKKAAIILFAGLVDGVRQLLPPFVATLEKWGEASQQWIIDATAPTRQRLQEYLDGVIAWGQNVLTNIRDRFNEIRDTIVDRVQTFIDNARSKIDDWREWLADKWESIRSTIAEKMEAVKNAVAEPVRAFIQETQDRIGGWYTSVVDWVSRIRDGIAERFGQVQSGITNFLDNVGWSWRSGWGSMADATAKSTGDVTKDVNESSGIWKGTWEKTLAYLSWWSDWGWRDAFYNPIVRWVMDTTRELTERWNKGVIGVTEAAQKLWHETMHFFNSLKDDAIASVIHWTGEIKKKIGDWIQYTQQDIQFWYNKVLIIYRDLRDGIVDKYNDMVQDAKDWVERTFSWFRPGEWLQKGIDLVEGLWDGLKQAWQRLKNWWNGESSSLGSDFERTYEMHSPSKVFAQYGINIMEGLQQGIASASQAPLSALQSFATQANNTITSVIEGVRYGANAVNLATADAIAQSRAAEKAAREAWEAAKNATRTPTVPTVPTTPTVPTVPVVPTTPPRGGGGAAYATPFSGRDLSAGLSELVGHPGSILGDYQDEDIAETMALLKKFGQHALSNLKLYGEVQGSSAAYMAYQSLTGPALETNSVNRVLNAIQTLIQELQVRGVAQQFLIQTPPNAAEEDRFELIQLVAYLNALYGAGA